MHPWLGKDTGSSAPQTSIQRDATLESVSRYEEPQSSEHRKSQFRSKQDPFAYRADTSFASFGHGSQDACHDMRAPFAPPHCSGSLVADAAIMADGANVLALLNSNGAYSDGIHGDDLVTTSATYASHRHEVDKQHSLAEQHKKQQGEKHHQTLPKHLQQTRLAELLAADDIVEYLSNQCYIDDVYGLPAPFEDLVAQARQEATESNNDTPRKAVQRLQMIQQHLLSKSKGSPAKAASTAYEMQDSDWSLFFSE